MVPLAYAVDPRYGKSAPIEHFYNTDAISVFKEQQEFASALLKSAAHCGMTISLKTDYL
jgi:hypothetical protein